MEVRDWLSQYQGGSVSLHKNEDSGVATILIANEGKKNAFTGGKLEWRRQSHPSKG